MSFPPDNIRCFRYAPHGEVLDYLLLGWMVVADMGAAHAEYRCLMEWKCGCAMIEPKKVKAE